MTARNISRFASAAYDAGMGEPTLHRYQATRAQAFRATAHRTIELAWVERGTAAYGVGSTTLALGPGAAIVVPPEVEHATSFAPAMVGRSLHLDGAIAYEIASAIGVTLGREPVAIRDAGSLIELANAIDRELRTPAAGQALLLDALVEAAVVTALRGLPARAANRNRDARIARAVDLVHDRFADPLTIDELARAAAMSRYHFSRAFRAALGASPYQYLQRVRIERARELLHGSRRSITEVALAVGFTDLGRFSRAFRAHLGHLPSEARSADRSARIA